MVEAETVDRFDAVVVGAGVVGLACARALAAAGRSVLILEQAHGYGSGVSSRNSEVVHAGLYDAPGSLKATLCVRGRRLLAAYCAERGIAYRRCGKLVVATRRQDVDRLDALRERAAANGVDDLVPLSTAQARSLEPELACAAALWSPSSGIVDSHGLMTALLGDAEAAGALLAVDTRFSAAIRVGDGWRVRTARGARDDDGAPFDIDAPWLVNAGGLDAQRVARRIAGMPEACVPPRRLARGHYFSLVGRAPFSRLIYPLPVDGGLGVHLTLDLGGQAKFGPDVDWFESDAAAVALDYGVDVKRAATFAAEVRRYWPALPDGALAPAYAGIRPKLTGPGEPPADFRIDGPAQHSLPGVVHLFGIESPGLTAALAIAEVVVARLRQ